MPSIQESLQQIFRELEPYPSKLIAVTKTHPVEVLQETYNLGFKRFGENKVQELCQKQEILPKDIEWHLIGHLQRNKVKYIAPFVAMIHSVDSLELLREIDKQGVKFGRIIPCLLQVHIAEEEHKFGFASEEVPEVLQQIEAQVWSGARVVGLMGMATFTDNQTQIRHEFASLHQIWMQAKEISWKNLEMQELSMGMSGDYTLALKEGSTLIRVGSKIFGGR